MKLTSVKYLTGTGFKNIWLNKLMSIASIGVLVACMSVIGLAVAISINVENMLNDLERQNVVQVHFDDINAVLYKDSAVLGQEISEDDYTIHSYEDGIKLCAEIQKISNVNSVKYVSSESALQSLSDGSLDGYAGLFDDLDDIPVQSGAEVTMIDLNKFDETIAEIEALTGVESTFSAKDIAVKITTIERAISIVGFWIVAILMIISLVIVSNTIRVTMYNRKLEISIMKAVGATDSFVRLPFMIEGVTIGLLSAGITITVLYFVYNAVKDTIKNALSLANMIPFSDFFWIVFGIFAGIGCIAGLFSSAFMINKYLRKEGSEFRAL